MMVENCLNMKPNHLLVSDLLFPDKLGLFLKI